MNSKLKNITSFALILILQLLVFDHTHINTYINPYIYPLIILLLPFNIAGWALLLIAFALGFIIDVFNGTLGLHMFATVAMAALRPIIINLFSLGKADHSKRIQPAVHGFAVVLAFVSVLFLTHHSIYFILENYSWTNFGAVIARIGLSSIISISFGIMILFLLFNSRSNER